MAKFRNYFFCCLLVLSLSACHFKHVALYPNPLPQQKPPLRDIYVFLINLDGSRPQEVEKWAQEGYLPNIKRLFFEEGAVVENAINNFPTLSTPNHQGFISGLFPGHHGIPALDWFSRPLKRHIDYLKPQYAIKTTTLMFNYLQLLSDHVVSDAPQLLFKDLKEYPTLAVLEPAHHSASTYIPKRPPAKGALDFYFRETYETMDWVTLKSVMKYLREVPFAEFPRFSFINFYGMDNVGHFVGPDSERALDYYIHYDRALGKLVELLRSRGIWEKSTLILVSDHGQHYLKEIVDLKAMLKRVGFPIRYHSLEKNYVVWGDHGTGTSNLHFRIGKSWERIPSYQEIRNFPLPSGSHTDLVRAFLAEPSIEFVMLREDPETTHVYTKDQHARIFQKWEDGKMWYRYAPEPGQDPLGYSKEEKIQKWVEKKQFLDMETWLKATAHLQRPDAVVAIAQIFDDSRTGEMIIQTYPDKQFKEVKVSAHGSLEREDRRVNLLLHGPDIRPGRIPYARIVDVYPTLLALFGLETPAPMDGRLRTDLLSPQLLATPKYALQRQLANPTQEMAAKTAEEFLQFLQDLDSDQLNADEKEKRKQLSYELANFLTNKKIQRANHSASSTGGRLSLRDQKQNQKNTIK